MRTSIALLFAACAPEPDAGPGPGGEPPTPPSTSEPTTDTEAPSTSTETTGCGERAETGVYYIGQCVPDFTLPDAEGELFNLYEHRGQPVIVEVIGMWCGSCRALAPELDELYAERRAEGLEIVTIVAEDVGGNDPTLEDAGSWKSHLELDYVVVADVDGDVAPQWDRGGVVPMGYLIDGEGRITFFANATGTLEQWRYEVGLLLD